MTADPIKIFTITHIYFYFNLLCKEISIMTSKVLIRIIILLHNNNMNI